MKAFLYGIYVQWNLDIRNKEALLFYYLVPLLFYGFVGGFFLSVMPDFDTKIIVSMAVFGVTMGGILGSGMSVCTHYNSVLRKAYQVGNIPFWVYLAQNFISAFLHLMIMATIILISAPFIFDATLPISVLQFYIGIAGYSTICILLSSLLGLIFKSSNRMTMAAQCIFLPSILLSGTMVPLEMLNNSFKIVSNILPSSWIIQWLEGSAQYGWILLIGIIVVFTLVILRLNQVKHIDIS